MLEVDTEDNMGAVAGIAAGGVSLLISACMFWNVVYEDHGGDPGDFSAYANAINTDVFGLVVFWACCATNVLSPNKGVQSTALLASAGALFYLFTGVGPAYHQPWTSFGHVNMIRAWREDWIDNDVPIWSKKVLAAGIFAMIGYILSFGAVTLNASKAPDVAGPLEERLSPGRKSALLVSTAVTCVAGFLGCVCIWATGVCGSPDGLGNLVKVNGPLHQPTKDEIYDMLTYGSNKATKGATEYELYVLTTGITSCTMLVVIFQVVMLFTTDRNIANVLTFLSMSTGWFFLTSVSLFLYDVADAMSENDKRTAATGIVFCWLSTLGTLAGSCIVHELHDGVSNRVGVSSTSFDPLNHLRNSFSGQTTVNTTHASRFPGKHSSGVPSGARPSVDMLPKLKKDASPKPAKRRMEPLKAEKPEAPDDGAVVDAAVDGVVAHTDTNASATDEDLEPHL